MNDQGWAIRAEHGIFWYVTGCIAMPLRAPLFKRETHTTSRTET